MENQVTRDESMGKSEDGESLQTKRVARKSHSKSRNGCLNCKKRRIKCNEQKPQCSNCIKHASRCSFAINFPPPPLPSFTGLHAASPSFAGTASGSTPHLAEGLNSGHPPLNIMDLELLHNYNTSTALTIATIPNVQTFMRINVPRMGFSHPLVLHAVLAISALHLAHFKKGDSKAVYRNEAEYHYETALRLATAELQDINKDNYPSLYVFASLCSLLILAMGPAPGNFLLFTNDVIAEWSVMFRGFRGMRHILECDYGLLQNDDLVPLSKLSINQMNLPPSNNEHLEELRDMILATASDDPDLHLYITTLKNLAESFPIRQTQPCPQLVFVWLYRLSDEFVLCLQQRKPIALVILAHIVVLLNDLSSFWWIGGWIDHIMSEVYAALTEEFRMWLRWPMEEIGWLPG